MSITFTTKINRVFTATEGDLVNVVKKVEWTLVGEQDGSRFELPQTVDLGSPDPTNFAPFASLSEADVAAWVESSFANMDGVKAHIQFVLDKECAKAALESPAMPWAPAPDPVAPAPDTV